MADNSSIPVAGGTNETFANKDIGGVKFPKLILHNSGGAEIVTPTLKAANSGAALPTDTAWVMTIRDANANLTDGSLQTSATHTGAPVVNLDPYSQYEFVAASQTDAVLGATGARYDYIAGVLIVPATAAAGPVTIKDGNGANMTLYAGGAVTPLPDLRPFMVQLGVHALAATAPGWKLSTGANVSAVGIGRFT